MSGVVDFPVKPEARPYLEAFGRGDFIRDRREPDWLVGYRKASLARFAELGFPSRRSEAWRYIDLRPLEQRPMLPARSPKRASVRSSVRAGLAEISLAEPTHRVVLVDGRFSPELAALDRLPSGVWLGSTAAAIAERPELLRSRLETPPLDPARPFSSLNAAFFVDGFVLDIAPGVAMERPFEILHLASGDTDASLHTRSVVVAGEGSRAAVIETFSGAGAYWRNDVVEWRLAPDAELARVVVVEEAEEALHFGEMLGAASRLSSFVLLLGGRTLRQEVTARSEGERSRCHLGGAFLLSGRQEANILTTVDHAAPGGETRENFKGVAAGRAHGAFQGRITVRPGAQKVDAHQLSRNLVLSPRAAIDTKPELEIYADDVRCSHGAAVGDLDEAALFYLRARGIPNAEARRMLIEAFVREAVELVEPAPVREHLLSRVGSRLSSLEE